ncbi:MAG: type I glutamate--ammonia ligase [Fibrobacteria bacterium]|nr:type I glutamate--ammonia ligase [Fibrobacteria bacterium]
MKPSEVIKFAKEKNIQMVDLRFMDWVGIWQHFSIPLSELTEDSFKDGFGFDGSSIRGWQAIDNSDMIVLPDTKTVQIDPFFEHPTLVMICDIADPITHEPYSRDPRYITKKSLEYMKSTGIADTAFFGPEAEFFLFNSVQFENSINVSYAEVDSVEGKWNTGRDEGPNLGYKPRLKQGYFPVPPTDSLQDIRSEMALKMQEVGIYVECQHHEVATGGQCEIDMRFDKMLECADQLCWFKYVIKNVARQHNMTATFMPKPLFGDNGSGMHTHMSLWKDGTPLMAGDGYAGFSELGLYYIGGVLKHAKSILAFSNPTVNSYKRLVPGFEAPVNLAYSSRNRSAAVRIPMYSSSPKAKRMEFRSPDPSCNPYLAFPAMLMAGLDGIQNKIDPGEPLDKNIYDLSPEEKKGVPSVPRSLAGALDALEADHEYLLKGDVFTKDAIDKWLEYKREEEVNVIAQRPHPMEFELYFDI